MNLFRLRCLWGVQKNERREKERERAPNGMRLIVDLWGKLDVVPFFIGCLVKLAGEMSNTMHVRAIEALFWSLKCRQHAVVLEFHETKLQQRVGDLCGCAQRGCPSSLWILHENARSCSIPGKTAVGAHTYIAMTDGNLSPVSHDVIPVRSWCTQNKDTEAGGNTSTTERETRGGGLYPPRRPPIFRALRTASYNPTTPTHTASLPHLIPLGLQPALTFLKDDFDEEQLPFGGGHRGDVAEPGLLFSVIFLICAELVCVRVGVFSVPVCFFFDGAHSPCRPPATTPQHPAGDASVSRGVKRTHRGARVG